MMNTFPSLQTIKKLPKDQQVKQKLLTPPPSVISACMFCLHKCYQSSITFLYKQKGRESSEVMLQINKTNKG